MIDDIKDFHSPTGLEHHDTVGANWSPPAIRHPGASNISSLPWFVLMVGQHPGLKECTGKM